MQLADPIVEILPQPVAMADQLAQNLGRLVVQPGWCGPLLECQTREAGGVDRVRLGAFETGILEAPGEQWVEQRDPVPGRGQRGEQSSSSVRSLPRRPAQAARREHAAASRNLLDPR